MSIPKLLINALQTGKVVPFVGAGVSMHVKKSDDTSQSLFPSWKGFVEILAKELEEKGKPNEAAYVRASVNIESPKYLEAMQHAKLKLGNIAWYRTIDESFNKLKNDADNDSLQLARLIWKLSNNLIVTTNIDRVFQWTSFAPGDMQTLDVQNVEYADLLREEIPKRPTVWHLHGNVDHKEKIIFTRDQYEAFYREKDNEAKLQTLISLLGQRTFLFIGFSLDDAYIKEQLEYIHRIYKGGADSFFILLHEDERAGRDLPGYVRPIYFPDFGPQLEELIAELVQIAEAPKTVKDIPSVSHNIGNDEKERLRNHFNVPFASKGDAFVGRHGLQEQIWESLKSSGRAAIGQAVAIQGIGGLGKTQLAVEFAHAYRAEYENGVFWITADENIDNQLIKIGEELRWITEFDKGFDHSELVRNRFQKLSDCLVIFDNVDSEHPVENYLAEKRVRRHTLITSREEQPGYDPIKLNILSINAARELLLETANRLASSPDETTALENILSELDGLPLAVELVGGYLRRRSSISFGDYYEFLKNEPLDRLEEKFPGKTFTDHDKSIIRTLKISEGLLKETKYLEDLLDILAWSGISSIGYSLLKELVDTTDDLALKDALGVALELHFIKPEKGTTERYAIHRLLARVRQFEKPLADRKEWHEKIVESLEKWFRKKADESKILSEAEIEYDHLLTWQEYTLKFAPSRAVWLTMLKALPLIERGNYGEAQISIEEALRLYEKEYLDNDLLLAHIYKGLSNINLFLGRYSDQEKYIMSAYALQLDGKFSDPKLSADIIDGLGNLRNALGDYRKALELWKQALNMYRELFGQKHPNIAVSLNNIGAASDELGEHEIALELRKQALHMYRELFGEKHPSIASSLNNVGTTYDDLGKHRKALELKEQALKMFQELFGEQHPDIATSLNNIGYSYGELKEPRKSLELYKQASQMRQELFGEKHPSIATSLNNVGLAYGRLGEHRMALEFKERALILSRELLGDRHPTTLLVARNTVDEITKNGNPEKAGRLAAEFLPHIPASHALRGFFEKYGGPYQKAKKRGRKKKR
jgi:tetratricopeptide (TPR) repeat protein